uniref:Docking protein 1 n=1 Tax=Eptatretus burgeri TaxID=7764 RepID=A0A8C4WTF7_EPTBU
MSKSWRKYHLYLFGSSPWGLARLEFYRLSTVSDSIGTSAHRRICTIPERVIRLAEFWNVRGLGEASSSNSWGAGGPSPPGGTEGLVLGAEGGHVWLAVPEGEGADWLRTISRLAFKGKGFQEQRMMDVERECGDMENSLYSSIKKDSDYDVCIQLTSAAKRCGLNGHMTLKVAEQGLEVHPLDGSIGGQTYTWPYHLLRRFGRDINSFSFEAGRRCSSGPGTFTLLTSQGPDIFDIVSATVSRYKATCEKDSSPSSPLEHPVTLDSSTLSKHHNLHERVESGPEALSTSYSKSGIYSEPADVVMTSGDFERDGDERDIHYAYSHPISILSKPNDTLVELEKDSEMKTDKGIVTGCLPVPLSSLMSIPARLPRKLPRIGTTEQARIEPGVEWVADEHFGRKNDVPSCTPSKPQTSSDEYAVVNKKNKMKHRSSISRV